MPVIHEKFEHLLCIEVNGITITEEILEKAINKCIGDRRTRKSVTKKDTDEEIIETLINEQDVMNAISSAVNLKVKKPDTSVKFDEVRNMDLSLDNWETYTPEERKFAQLTLCAYNDYYDLNAPNDRTGIYDVIDLEVRMQTIRLFIRLCKKKDEIAEYDAKLKELRVQWSKALDDLNLKKKQRDNTKEKPKDTSDEHQNAIKSLDAMQAEAAKRKLEVKKKKEEKFKLNK